MKRKIFFFLLLLGITAVEINAQNSFSENFDGALLPGWQGSGMFKLTQAGGFLSINVGTTQKSMFFTLDLGTNINISSNPVANLKLRATDYPYILRMEIVDTSGGKAYKDVRVPTVVSYFVNYCFDFSSSTGVDKTAIRKIQFYVNPDANSYGGTIHFDDLLLGTGALKFANLAPVKDVLIYKTATAQKIIVSDIANASAITLAGGASIIQHIAISPISNGFCTITYDALAPGSDIITLTASGTTGYGNNSISFNLTVEDNNPPTITQPANQSIPVGKSTTIKLSGISDGNESAEQTITLSATSNNPSIIPNPTISYPMQGSPYASLTLTANSAGTATITLTLQDNGSPNNVTTKTFDVTAYNGFNNPPTLNTPLTQTMYLGAGPLKVKLSGISDGDGGTQNLSFSASSQNGTINSATVSYSQGKDTAILTLSAASVGKDTITITLTDNGGNGSNNGNQSCTVSFVVEVLQPAKTGYVIPMNNFSADTAAKLWTIESQGVTQFASYVDTLGKRCLRIIINQKTNWTGTWYNFPEELDLSKAPYVSYEILATGFSPLQTHAYFWDVYGKRNTTGAHLERDTINNPSSGFTKVFFDFRKPNYLNDDEGNPIAANRIIQLLINYHDKFVWPNNTISGVVYISDIRVGDSCKNVPPVTPVCTINNVPTQVQWAGAETHTLTLSGISNGAGSITGVTITALSSKTPFIPHPTVGTINANGEATLSYSIQNTNIDSAQIVIRVNATGSIQKEIRFFIKTVSPNPAVAGAVTVDASVKGQTMVGFGTANQMKESQLEAYAKDQGCTMMRLFDEYKNFEITNDNHDPNNLDRSKVNKAALDLDFIRKAHEAGVTDFFITLLSPPVWMMQSLSTNATEGAPDWNATNQKVDPIYYDEYVEAMVSMIRLIKEETGVEIYAICPQNEPSFTEPYGSAILDPQHMAQVCGMLGKRLAQEGFSTKVINSEQVFGQGYNPVVAYISAVRADADANQYTHIIGMHYPDANVSQWSAQWTACKASPAKMLWATECTSDGNNFGAILNQAHYMITGFNYGCSAWIGLGYNSGSSSTDNDVTNKGGHMSGPNKLKHFYAFKNFAKYIRKGAVQLKTTVTGVSNVYAASFSHEQDSTMTIVLLNKDLKNPAAIKLFGSAPATGWEAYRTSYYEKCERVYPFKDKLIYLPPGSITTLYIKTNINHAPTIDAVADINLSKNSGTGVTLTGIGCGDPVPQNITITATSSNPAILPNPTVTYTSPNDKATLLIKPVDEATGQVTVTIIVKDDGGRANGGIDADTITFKVTIGEAAIKDLSGKMSLYPNPATDMIHLTLPDELIHGQLFISNTSGQIIKEVNLNGKSQISIDTDDLAAGTYLIHVSANGKKAQTSFIKK